VASLVPFTLDLTAHEATRLAAVLDALGPHWNPTDIYTGEAMRIGCCMPILTLTPTSRHLRRAAGRRCAP
jgi:hypothetical protein